MAPALLTWLRRVLPIAVVVLAGAVTACGDDEAPSGAPTITGAAAKHGQQLAKVNGCQDCHSTTGERMTGPTWKDLAGSEVDLASGRTVTADEVYLASSITDPDADVVEGFPAIMPSYDLTDEEVDDLVVYLRQLAPGAER